MKKFCFICFLSFCLFNANGQNISDIIIGKIDSIDSKILNEQRKVWVYVPDGNVNSRFIKKKYPVVYLLDGHLHFHSVVGMIQQLSSVNDNTIVPEMIVVGIPNTNRFRDLTPTNDYSSFFDSTMVANSGGGENFISFLEKELIPKIDSEYPTDPYRIFIGHSLGGLLVMHTLQHYPELFNAYVAIDPTMVWNNQNLLKDIKQTSFDEKYNGKTLFLGIANTLMDEDADILGVQKDTSEVTIHIRSILELNAYLNQSSQKQLRFKGKYYEDDTHGSVPFIAEYDALRFIFDFYHLKFEKQDFLDPESTTLNKVVNHYIMLSKAFGYEIKPDEKFINNMGYQFLNMEQLEKAEQFFKLNIMNYPESFNAYDSLGDFYDATGNEEKAIENYKKSISINKDSFSKDKLEKLEKN